MIYILIVLLIIVVAVVSFFVVRNRRSPSSKTFDQNVQEFKAELSSVLNDETIHQPAEFQNEEEWLSRRSPPDSPAITRRFCCEQFQDMMNRAGQPGYSIIAVEDRSHTQAGLFFMQARATEENHSITLVEGADAARPIMADVAIQYCPWCGKNLDRYYKAWSLPYHPELTLDFKPDPR